MVLKIYKHQYYISVQINLRLFLFPSYPRPYISIRESTLQWTKSKIPVLFLKLRSALPIPEHSNRANPKPFKHQSGLGQFWVNSSHCWWYTSGNLVAHWPATNASNLQPEHHQRHSNWVNKADNNGLIGSMEFVGFPTIPCQPIYLYTLIWTPWTIFDLHLLRFLTSWDIHQWQIWLKFLMSFTATSDTFEPTWTH